MKLSSLTLVFWTFASSLAKVEEKATAAKIEEDMEWFNDRVLQMSFSMPTPTPPPTPGPTPAPSASTPMPTICTPPPTQCPPPTPGVTPDPGCQEPPSACPDPTPSPTPAPSAEPTPGPTPEPTTPMPTLCTPPPTNCPPPTPGGSPTNTLCTEPPSACPPAQECNIDIRLDPGCPCTSCEFELCEERPFRMEFFYKGGNCSFMEFRRCPEGSDLCDCNKTVIEDPDDFPNGDKISCADFYYDDGAGPPDELEESTTIWLRANEQGKPDKGLYFDGPVDVGSFFNATTDEKKVAANMDIQVFEYDAVNDGPGRLLQAVVFHSSCSETLYLGDVFGGSQLVEFEDQDGLIVSLFRQSADFNFTLDIGIDLGTGADSLVLDSASAVLLADNGIIPPQVKLYDVAGQTLPPELLLESTFDSFVLDTEFTLISTIGGRVDGRQCFDIVSSEFACNNRDDNCPENTRLLGQVRHIDNGFMTEYEEYYIKHREGRL